MFDAAHGPPPAPAVTRKDYERELAANRPNAQVMTEWYAQQEAAIRAGFEAAGRRQAQKEADQAACRAEVAAIPLLPKGASDAAKVARAAQVEAAVAKYMGKI